MTDGESTQDRIEDVGQADGVTRDRIEDVIDEIRRIEDRADDWYLQSESDFHSIFRFNILVAGGFLTVFGYFVGGRAYIDVSGWVAAGFLVAFGFWAMSTFSVALSYIGLYVRFGIDHVLLPASESEASPRKGFEGSSKEGNEYGVSIDELVDKDDGDYYRTVLEAYRRTLEHNDKVTSSYRWALLNASVLLLLDAVIVFAITLPFTNDELVSSLPAMVEWVLWGGALLATGVGVFLSVGVFWNCWLFRDRLRWKVRAFLYRETAPPSVEPYEDE